MHASIKDNELNYGDSPITVFVNERVNGARIGVRDRGAGFPEAMWPDAGSRFTKNAGVSATSAGLGLAIVSAVAKAHGGCMEIDRPSAMAFVVYLDLPLVLEDAG